MTSPHKCCKMFFGSLFKVFEEVFYKATRSNLTIENFIRFNSEIFFQAKGTSAMKKIFLMLAAVILLMTGCGSDFDSREVIIVGFDESPLGYRNEKGEIVGRFATIKLGKAFEILNVTVGKMNQYGMGFRKDDFKLRDRIQATFDSMIKDGTAKKISEQWFQADLIKRSK